MEIELTKIEIALTLSAIGKKLKRTKDQISKFESNIEKGYYERFNYKQKRRIRRNKTYKIEVLSNLQERLKKAITEDECRLVLSEMDFDYSELKCTELTEK